MPCATVQGRRAHYVCRQPPPGGKAPGRHAQAGETPGLDAGPVAFVHGAGGSHQHWLYQVRDLAPHLTYSIDLPGHGRSEGPGRDSISAYGDWLVGFLDEVGVRKATLVGHSMGGGIALDVALRFPARVAGLGLVGTGARLRVAPAILLGIREDFATAVQLVNEWAFGPEAPPEMVRLGRRQMSATSPDVLHGDFAACDAFDVMRRLDEISVPTAVVCGTRDVLTPPKYSMYLRDHIAGASLHLVEGAGHMVMVEKPQAVVHALRRP